MGPVPTARLDLSPAILHCRLGGRASLVAADLLVSEGHIPTEAWNIVRQVRGLEVPDTSEVATA